MKMLLLFVDEEATSNWPEVLQFMFDCVQSDDARLKDAALQIFRYACHSNLTWWSLNSHTCALLILTNRAWWIPRCIISEFPGIIGQ